MNANLFDKPAVPEEKITTTDRLAQPLQDQATEFGLFDSVFHEVNNAIAIIESDQNGKAPIILDVNHHFELMTGYSFSELYERHLYDYMENYDHTETSGTISNRSFIEQALKNRQSAVLFCPWVNRDGTVVDVDMTIRPFSGSPAQSRFICVLREHAGADHTSDNAARNKAARETKRNLLSAMHHNLKTPLNGILGYSEVIMSEMLGPIGQENYRHYAQDIHGAGRDLLQLIDNLLELKELETSEFALNETVFTLRDMVEKCLEKIQQDIGEKDIELVFDLQAPDLKLWGDKSRLQQLIYSLLTNSLKFTPPGGKITLRAGRDNAEGCLISCTDNGRGMSSQQLAKVFCHDTHLSNVYSDPTVGMGFGLSYVKQIIEKHGGRVSIISAIGSGTTVTLCLPASRLR